MSKRRFASAYPAELREGGILLFRETRADCTSDTTAFRAIALKLGCSPDSLRAWCQQAERDTGQRAGLTRAEKGRAKASEPEVRELRTANEILKKASAYLAIDVLARKIAGWRVSASMTTALVALPLH
ncbi:hypothetical protein [Sedimentitalea nanhaiensis]|uniref:Transposase n=1 Tax=Sedimentitalea nanhaiensis TaxID=999627 RepID=A0A1I7C5R3_9RHOB|nr:hypothetical protein SAMN05216236_11492 [Sedimentitalea nanhaiensis]